MIFILKLIAINLLSYGIWLIIKSFIVAHKKERRKKEYERYAKAVAEEGE